MRFPDIILSITTAENPLSHTVPASSNSDVIHNARVQIDAEIDILSRAESVMRILKTRRNFLAPISRLIPAELLCYIFASLANALQASEQRKRIQWIRVTQVCRHWRDIAIDCASLWSYIDLSYPNWGLTMLGRSKMFPLCITTGSSGRSNTEELLFALGHISRIRELHLSASYSTPLYKILAKISAPAPLLEKLCLIENDAYYSTGTAQKMSQITFNGQTPRLRHLELTNIPLPSHLSLLGLTYLDIRMTSSIHRSQSIGDPDFLSSIREMPLLRSLRLAEGASDQIVETLQFRANEPLVELRNLCELHLSGGQLRCARFISHLSFPVTAKLHLDCRVTAVADESQSPRLLSIVEDRVGTVSGHLPYSAVSVEIDSGLFRKFSFRAWVIETNTVDLDQRPLDQAASFKLSLRWDQAARPDIALAGVAICEFLPVSEVKTLYLDQFGNADEADSLVYTLRQFKAVERLVVHGPAADLCDVLAHEEDRITGEWNANLAEYSDNDDYDDLDLDDPRTYERNEYAYESISLPADPAFLPNLRQIIFEDTDFQRHGHRPSGDSASYCLGVFAANRHDRGAYLEAMELKGCRNIEKDSFFEIQRYVEALSWDKNPVAEEEAADASNETDISGADENNEDDETDDDDDDEEEEEDYDDESDYYDIHF